MFTAKKITAKTEQINASVKISIGPLPVDDISPNDTVFLIVDPMNDEYVLKNVTKHTSEKIGDTTKASAFVLEKEGIRLLYMPVTKSYWARIGRKRLDLGDNPQVVADVLNYILTQ